MSDQIPPHKRGSGSAFLGTITQQLEDSGHVSIVDETGDSYHATPMPRPKFKKGKRGGGKASAANTTTWSRNRSPKKSRSSSHVQPTNTSNSSRSKSPVRSTSTGTKSPMTADPSLEGSSRRHTASIASSTRSFVSRQHSHSAGGIEGEDNDFDDDDDFDVRGSTPNSSQRGSTTAPARKSFWKDKSREGIVDQRVNLMDAETGKYERQASAPRNLGFRQKSLVDIFLHDEFGSSDHNNRRGLGDSLSSINKERSGGWIKWLLVFVFFGCLLVGAVLSLPQFGLVQSIAVEGENNNKDTGTQQTTNSPTPAPTTASPTPAPTEEEIIQEDLEPEQEEAEPINDIATEEGGGPSLAEWLKPQDSPVEVFSPNPEESSANLDTVRGGPDDSDLVLTTTVIPTASPTVIPTASPTASRSDALQFLVTDQDVSETGSFEDPNSAPSKALQWIAEEDTAQLPIPGVDTVDDDAQVVAERKVLQRYAVAVFYFSQQVGPAEGDETGQRLRRRLLVDATQEELNSRHQFDLEWLSETSVCDWPGVTCNANKMVTALDMSHSLLGGALPREIMKGSALPAMTTLDVSYNQLQGTLPRLYESNPTTGSSMLPSENALEFLFLQHNGIQGNIDPIVTLEQLTSVDLSNNEFTGSIPADFGTKLKQLDTLHLARNYLQGTLPSELSELTELASMDLQANLFTGSIPSEWSTLTELEVLTLSHCETIEGTIPSALASMTGLKIVYLQKTSLKGTIPTFLGDLPHLKELYLHSTGLSGTMPEEVCALTNTGLEALTSDCSELGSVICSSDCCTDCFWR